MITSSGDVLAGSSRGLLAFRSGRGPALVPTAYWYDGAALWTTTAADSEATRALERDGACVLYVPAPTGGVVAHAHARVLSLRDPVALLLRAPAITGAVTGLALASPATVLGYARAAVRAPARWAPGSLAVLRVTVDRAEAVPAGAPPPGVAPALPATVPADVRRALAGVRVVAIARSTPAGGIEVVGGWWDTGFALAHSPDGAPVAAEGEVAVAVDADPQASPPQACGVVLTGPVEGGALRPRRATWWRGPAVDAADLPPARPGIVLPD